MNKATKMNSEDAILTYFGDSEAGDYSSDDDGSSYELCLSETDEQDDEINGAEDDITTNSTAANHITDITDANSTAFNHTAANNTAANHTDVELFGADVLLAGLLEDQFTGNIQNSADNRPTKRIRSNEDPINSEDDGKIRFFFNFIRKNK